MARTQKAQAPVSASRLDPQAREALQAAMAALEAASKALAAVAAAQQAHPTAKAATPAKAPAAKAVPQPKTAEPVKAPRAERRAAHKAAHAAALAEYARTHMSDADGPATASQLWYLHLLLGTDTRTPKYAKLTKAQAARMITELKAKKPRTRSA